MEKESTALFATARLWDDGLIDPRDSRKVLALCLSICREAEVRPLKAQHVRRGADVGCHHHALHDHEGFRDDRACL